MTLAQHGMWLTERAGLGGPVHHMPLRVRFDGPLEVDTLLAACDAVVARHPALSAAFPEGRAVYGTAKPPVELVDGDPDLDAAQPFDLDRGPLIRFGLYRVGPERHVLQVVAHHLIFDGVSKDLLLADLAAAYSGTLPPVSPHVSPPALPLAGEDPGAEEVSRAALFWADRWRDSAAVLPGGVRHAPRPTRAEAVDLDLDGLEEVAARLGVTRFEALVTALALVLHGYGDERPALAVDVSTRTPATDAAVGHHVNELPLFVTPGATVAETAAAVRAELRAMYRHRQVPVARAVHGISPRSALLPVTVSFRERRLAEPRFPGVETEVDWAVPTGWIRGSLHLQVVDHLARLQFDPRLPGAELAGRLRDVLHAPPATPTDALAPRGTSAHAVPPVAVPELAGRDGEAAPAVAWPGADGVAADPQRIGQLTEQVMGIWREVLTIEQVAPDDDLYDLGGHSLTITQIIARVRERMGVELSFEVFIDTPTPLGIAAEIARA